jgi:uncharacterized protein (TIGR02284 family)
MRLAGFGHDASHRCAGKGAQRSQRTERKERAMDKDDVVDTLNDLIETCKDGEYGFRECADRTKTAQLKQTLNARAEECARGASELQALVLQFGGTPDSDGSATGSLHRGWVAVRNAVTSDSDLRMLEECERGEDAAEARYRKALKDEGLPASVRAVVERQLEGVRRNHQMIKGLRDRLKAEQG